MRRLFGNSRIERCNISAYHVVQLNISDTDCLVKSLEELGYKAEVHDKPVNLVGYRGDTRSQKANVVIKRADIGGASNDIGFLQKEDGNYEMIISEYDKRAAHGKKFTQSLNQVYAKNTSLLKASQLGCTFLNQRVDDKGRIRIRLQTGH